MPVWNITTLSSATLSGRIDGEYYLPEYIVNQDTLLKIETRSLPYYFFISDGNHLSVSKHFSDSVGVPYFRGQDITDFFIENASPVRIPPAVFWSPMMRRSHFQSGDVLLSIVGTIGSLSLVPDSLGPATGSCKIAILRSKGDYSAHFLAAFLLSKYGQLQIHRNTRGAVQMGLILKDFSRITIPVFPEEAQEEAAELMKTSIAVNTQSRLLYSEAQHLLESELGLDKLSLQRPNGYPARSSLVYLSDTFAAGRADAQCFAPDALFYEDWLLKHTNCARLCGFLHGTAKGRKQTESSFGLTDYCSIKHISGREIVGASRCSPAKDTEIATEDDLLLAITGATIGKIGIVKRYSRLAFSGDLLRLRVKQTIDPHYLLLVLDHALGQVQFNRWITGSTNGHLAPRDVGRVLIPRLNSDIETRIAKPVQMALAKRLESEQLIEDAKSRVEKLIEQAVKS